MPVDASGNSYTVDPKTGQYLPVTNGQSSQPYQYGGTSFSGPARTTTGTSSTTPSGSASSNLPSFSSSMTPDQAQALANQYLQAAGLPPDTGGTWAKYWQQFGSNDPNYFTTRLLNGAASQGGNMSQWSSLQSPTVPGGWGPGTSGYGPSTSGPGGAQGSPYGTNGYMGSPGYAYEQQAANNAVQASAAARGTLLTTGTQRDLQANAAGLAGQAFGLDSSNLLQLAGIGQNATNNAGSYIVAGANANAGGQINSANAQMTGTNNFNNAVQTGYNNGQFPGQSGTNGPNMQPQGPYNNAASNAAQTTQNYIYAKNNIPTGEDDPTTGGG